MEIFFFFFFAKVTENGVRKANYKLCPTGYAFLKNSGIGHFKCIWRRNTPNQYNKSKLSLMLVYLALLDILCCK